MALVKCPECHQDVSTKAAACPHCGAPVKKPAQPQAKRGGCAMMLIVMLLGGLCYGATLMGNAVFSPSEVVDAEPTPTQAAWRLTPYDMLPAVQRRKQATLTAEARSVPKSNAPAMSVLSVGSVGRVVKGPVSLSKTEADHNEFIRLGLANDVVGGQRMIDEGRVIAVEIGTKVKVIEIGMGVYRVRILDGPHAEQDGWLIYEAVGQ